MPKSTPKPKLLHGFADDRYRISIFYPANPAEGLEPQHRIHPAFRMTIAGNIGRSAGLLEVSRALVHVMPGGRELRLTPSMDPGSYRLRVRGALRTIRLPLPAPVGPSRSPMGCHWRIAGGALFVTLPEWLPPYPPGPLLQSLMDEMDARARGAHMVVNRDRYQQKLLEKEAEAKAADKATPSWANPAAARGAFPPLRQPDAEVPANLPAIPKPPPRPAAPAAPRQPYRSICERMPDPVITARGKAKGLWQIDEAPGIS